MRKETIFDLASLTKPLATTLAMMRLLDEGKCDLDQRLEELLPVSLSPDKRDLTPRLLLCHSAGLLEWAPLYLDLQSREPNSRKRILRETLLEMPLSYLPGEGSAYSDLGFMLLEWIIEEVSGSPFSSFLAQTFYGPLGLGRTFLSGGAPLFPEEEFAPTEACPWRKMTLIGTVHDENASILGGCSGHAGLFGTAEEVYRLAMLLLDHYTGKRFDYLNPRTVKRFFERQNLAPGSTWALGWDTPSEKGSSAGKRFSARSVGHLGFTGTSLWMDLEREVIVVLLTNRIHPSRDNIKIRAFRPRMHDLIMEELG
jgi:serine-type D-Ala-D-Ala carboxypeptidase